MAIRSDIAAALRVAFSWLLMVALFLGPVGAEGTTALAAASAPCETSCPCDAEEHEADEELSEHGCQDEHADCDDGPCEDDDGCDDDCGKCGCCASLSLVATPWIPTATRPHSPSSRIAAPAESLARGTPPEIFRPPRR